MHVPRIYIETSVVNMFFDAHAAKRQEYTIQFFEEIHKGNYIPFSSAYVLQEIELAESKNVKR